MDFIDEYRDEYRNSLSKIRTKIVSKRPPKLNPYLISHEIVRRIKRFKDSGDVVTLTGVSDRIRKFHDFYGWMSKGRAESQGLCSGTLYRTKEYLAIDPKERSGRKVDKNSVGGVHIEHSIPVKTLREILLKNINVHSTAQQVFGYFFVRAFPAPMSETTYSKDYPAVTLILER